MGVKINVNELYGIDNEQSKTRAMIYDPAKLTDSLVHTDTAIKLK